MKISDLIKKLQILQDKHGDNELTFKVKDPYSIYGHEMQLYLKVGDTDGMPSDWFGTFTNGNNTMIEFHMKDNSEGKKAKITFRK